MNIASVAILGGFICAVPAMTYCRIESPGQLTAVRILLPLLVAAVLLTLNGITAEAGPWWWLALFLVFTGCAVGSVVGDIIGFAIKRRN